MEAEEKARKIERKVKLRALEETYPGKKICGVFSVTTRHKSKTSLLFPSIYDAQPDRYPAEFPTNLPDNSELVLDRQ